MAKILMWGKCSVKFTPIDGSGATINAAVTLPTPIRNSTVLTPQEGDKVDAEVEGGGVEASRRNSPKYTLATNVRITSTNKTDQLGSVNGIVPGEYEVEVKPLENNAAPVLNIARASVTVMKNYTAEEGGYFAYSAEVLLPETGEMVSIS